MKKLQKKTIAFILIIYLVSLNYIRYNLYPITFYTSIRKINFYYPSQISLGNIGNNSSAFNGTIPPLDFLNIPLLVILLPILSGISYLLFYLFSNFLKSRIFGGKYRYKTRKIYRINEFLELRLEGDDTIIYVSGEPFEQCKYLLLNVPMDRLHDFDSIDQAQEYLEDDLEAELTPEEVGLEPEEEFHAHCSNLQVWYENDYDTTLLHRNLAFPLLKVLVESGDKKAEKIFKEEIRERFKSLYPPVQSYLIQEGYLNYFEKDEIINLLNLISNGQVWEEIAESCEIQKQYLGAIEALKRALHLDPINYKTLLKLAETYLKIGDNQLAISTYKNLLELYPYKNALKTSIGECYMKAGDTTNAKKMFMEALKMNQCDYYTWELLGRIFRTEGKINKAIQAFKLSVQFYPYTIDPWIEISLLYVHKIKPSLAVKNLKKALEYNPENVFLWLALKRIMRRIGKGWTTFFLFFKFKKKWKKLRKIQKS